MTSVHQHKQHQTSQSCQKTVTTAHWSRFTIFVQQVFFDAQYGKLGIYGVQQFILFRKQYVTFIRKRSLN